MVGLFIRRLDDSGKDYLLVPKESNGFYGELEGDTYVIKGYVGSTSNVVIPSSIEGHKTSLSKDFRFGDQYDIGNFIVGASIKELPDYSFYFCKFNAFYYEILEKKKYNLLKPSKSSLFDSCRISKYLAEQHCGFQQLQPVGEISSLPQRSFHFLLQRTHK